MPRFGTSGSRLAECSSSDRVTSEGPICGCGAFPAEGPIFGCGACPFQPAPIVERLGLNQSNCVETVRGFGRLFQHAAGRSSSLVDAAARSSRRWFQGKPAARTALV